MSETANSEGSSSELEKPVPIIDVKFPPFPEPTDDDFEEDITDEERKYYKQKYSDLNLIVQQRIHCTACDRHLGCMARNEARMRPHPMLHTLMCHICFTFYNSGEFEKGDDGSELYCRWCGQGGQVYCCSDCPHVFCAKCIKRNMGAPKIKEIEGADDWKCFKCNPRCLWDLRAMCWALLRYCDLKNKFVYSTQDQDLKEAYQRNCAVDHSRCCKHKIKQKRIEIIKKREERKMPDLALKKATATAISKIPSTIQVKKFASINVEDSKMDRKPQKRPASPKHKPLIIRKPITIAPAPSPKLVNPMSMPPLPKKIKICNTNIMPPIRFNNDRNPFKTYPRIRGRNPQLPMNIMNHQFNGFNNANNFNMPINDNINLSLESLTQGLDMSAVAATIANSNNNTMDDDVVCTPDFPLEPLCEVTEDNTDDDVQCITPAPTAPSRFVNPPPLVPCSANMPDLSADNVIQMTENDVTVNAATGGLKFRVDPQTLSSNKMYRLPDGRIFAINANSNMPGGYSATIVAVTETGTKPPSKTQTFAAKLSAVSTSTSNPRTSTPVSKFTRQSSRLANMNRHSKINSPMPIKISKPVRECDLNISVEWYRYNLIDAVDALEYSLSRLHKLKKEATTMYLRTRTVTEMRNLHRSLERLLNTSSSRFNEIRDSLNKELKHFLMKKRGSSISEDDDDVEILPDMDENDDPIFIDENSLDSNTMCIDNHEVDLTGVASSEHNDSGENRNNSFTEIDKDNFSIDNNKETSTDETNDTINNQNKKVASKKVIAKKDQNNETDDEICPNIENENVGDEESYKTLDKLKCDESVSDCDINEQQTHIKKEKTSDNDITVNNDSEVLDDNSKSNDKEQDIESVDRKENDAEEMNVEKKMDTENGSLNKVKLESNGDDMKDTEFNIEKLQESETGDEKIQDNDISDEMIESLLKEEIEKDSIDCT